MNSKFSNKFKRKSFIVENKDDIYSVVDIKIKSTWLKFTEKELADDVADQLNGVNYSDVYKLIEFN